MRSKKNVETIKLQDGEYLEKKFDNYIDMATNAVDWTIFCNYELKPKSSNGIYKILSLPNIQIVYSKYNGGAMHNFVTPYDTVTFSIVASLKHKACLDQIKLKTDDIVIMNDTQQHNFIYSDEIEVFDISFKKNGNPQLYEELSSVVNKLFIDENKKIALFFQTIIDKYSKSKKLNKKTSMEVEKKIISTVSKLLYTQEAKTPKLTKSEKITLQIREKFFNHMDINIDIKGLAKEHHISEKSLQNSFNSLFGFTPKQFLLLLKLNLVRHELVKSSSKNITVSRVAQKWGFKHMGRFAKYYKSLFVENPSQTLKRENPFNDGMNAVCVNTKEEI